MTRRYFISHPIPRQAAGGSGGFPAVTLDGAEAHHLLHVLRATPGERVVVFDGSGWEFDAAVVSCQRTSVELTIEGARQIDRELPWSITLGCPLPKGERTRWLVEKAVELGVTRMVPLITEHTERAARDAKSAGKLRRYVIEASKQCGRNRLMAVAEPTAWDRWLVLPDQTREDLPNATARRWIAHPGGRPLSQAPNVAPPAPVFIGIGPEGGLTDREIEQSLAAGWEAVSLGSRTLRTETAAAAMVVAATVLSG